MQLIIQVLTGLAIAGLSGAHPSEDWSLSEFGKRALTPDNTCGTLGAGKGLGYTCDPKLAQGGGCCSASGYCGRWRGHLLWGLSLTRSRHHGGLLRCWLPNSLWYMLWLRVDSNRS